MTSSTPSKLEWLTVTQVAAMVIFASWAFGGNIGWARSALSITGCLSLFILAVGVRGRLASPQGKLTSLHTLWFLLGFNILVILGQLQPGLRIVAIEGGFGYVPRTDLTAWPSSARPDLAWREILLFNSLFLPCFNLLFIVRHRRILRWLLLVIAANALALAVFGSLQKLGGASGLYFGSVVSPNAQFFASFIYRNHWGAFAVLMLAICIGLIFCERPWSAYRDFWHSPALAAVVATLFLVAAIVLSGARACSALALTLVAIATLDAMKRVWRHRRSEGRSTAGPVIMLSLCLGLVGVGIYSVTKESIATRLSDTRGQLAHMQATHSIGSRAQLYGDTWRMARDRLWTGWGLGSYGTVFTLYNTQFSRADGLPVYYADAHSDWLQWLAETGIAGTILLLGLFATPLILAGSTRNHSVLPRYLLLGCGLVMLYSCFEFPLANPAVLLSFWTCLFCAVRWSQLEARERSA